jgi:hypothetical protein
MGCCGSKVPPQQTEEEKKKSKEVDSKMQQEYQQDRQINKLLLLGSGESGKSTLFKQLLRSLLFPPSFPSSFLSSCRSSFLSSLLFPRAVVLHRSFLFLSFFSIYGEGLSASDYQGYVSLIHGNVVQGMKTLCKYSDVRPSLFLFLFSLCPLSPFLICSLSFDADVRCCC